MRGWSPGAALSSSRMQRVSEGEGGRRSKAAVESATAGLARSPKGWRGSPRDDSRIGYLEAGMHVSAWVRGGGPQGELGEQPSRGRYRRKMAKHYSQSRSRLSRDAGYPASEERSSAPTLHARGRLFAKMRVTTGSKRRRLLGKGWGIVPMRCRLWVVIGGPWRRGAEVDHATVGVRRVLLYAVLREIGAMGAAGGRRMREGGLGGRGGRSRGGALGVGSEVSRWMGGGWGGEEGWGGRVQEEGRRVWGMRYGRDSAERFGDGKRPGKGSRGAQIRGRLRRRGRGVRMSNLYHFK